MLKRLQLENFFTHKDREFVFDKGLTGIVGPNESGKSLIVEAIRYGLFGSKALRGAAEDYRDAYVELDFEVRGQEYRVIRKGARAELVDIATGTRPVNEAIQRILGYDLTVFDVANACNQGDVEKLTNMRPAERKQMVDQTIGLNVLDAVISYCGSEGNALKREAEGVASVLLEPEVPQEPEGYEASEKLQETVTEYRGLVREYRELKGALAHRPTKPVKPKKCPVSADLGQLLAQQERREILERSIKNTDAALADLKLPRFTVDELDSYERHWDLFDAWRRKKRLLDQGEHRCPACDHTWPVAGEDLLDFEGIQETDEPPASRKEIEEERRRTRNVLKYNELEKRLNGFVAELADLPDVSEEIKVRRAYEAEVATYEAAKKAYDAFMTDVATKEERLEELMGVEEALETFERELKVQLDYERDLRAYQQQKEKYDENVKRYEALKQRSEAFLVSRTAIQELKTQVKTHLLPSLNKVASMLLNQMTGGERYRIEIDEDFDILVDGQSVQTLSGSGKAVANLAIRIALGQILTNRVFSVFLADEVDAAMDDDRAAYTAEALRRLTDTVGQVVQITHKRPETDHTFELKK